MQSPRRTHASSHHIIPPLSHNLLCGLLHDHRFITHKSGNRLKALAVYFAFHEAQHRPPDRLSNLEAKHALCQGLLVSTKGQLAHSLLHLCYWDKAVFDVI